MSSRHQKEKRLRPRNDPYKREHFDRSRYLQVSLPQHIDGLNQEEQIEDSCDIDDYDDVS
jgi:hypothetical protein